MNSRKKRWFCFLGLMLLWPTASAFWKLDPIHRSPPEIRQYLLKRTPLGSSYKQVRETVEKEGWLNRNYIGSGGYIVQENGEAAYEVGVSSIGGHVGDYGFPFRAYVDAFWGFDESGQLVDVWVWKNVRGL